MKENRRIRVSRIAIASALLVQALFWFAMSLIQNLHFFLRGSGMPSLVFPAFWLIGMVLYGGILFGSRKSQKTCYVLLIPLFCLFLVFTVSIALSALRSGGIPDIFPVLFTGYLLLLGLMNLSLFILRDRERP